MSEVIYKDPNRFYVYAYLREDGSPYYIGKGTNKRAWSKTSKLAKLPNDESRIIILKQNLTEQEAFDHEKELIRFYGRKDNGTGILRNMTDGGEGISGLRHSEESKKKMSKSKSGEKSYQYGKPLSEETKRKISASKMGEKNCNYGKKLSKEAREHLSKIQKGKKVSEETKKKISESRLGSKNHNYGKPLKPETIKKLSEALSGTKNPRYGKTHTPEARQKISEGLKLRAAKMKLLTTVVNETVIILDQSEKIIFQETST